MGVEEARAAERAWISTIHGLCRRLLKRHALEAGLDPGFGVCDEVQAGLLRRKAFEAAVRALAESENARRLLADYDVGEIEAGVRTVDEHIRSLGATYTDLGLPACDVGHALAEAKHELRSLLNEMCALENRGSAEETNIASLADLLDELETIDELDPEVGTAILSAASGFKPSRNCRVCAKPLADVVKAVVESLVAVSADQASAAYAEAFFELLERYAHEYEDAKRELGVLDFEDLQLKARDLLTARPDLARRYRESLVEVMVDEFQDTNELQCSVVSALAGQVLATVGDEKQSIYGWRNADVEVFRRRRSEVDESRTFILPENYRSHSDLVAVYNEMFSAAPFWPDDFMRLEVGVSESPAANASAFAWPEEERRVQLTLLEGDECSEMGKTLAEARAVAQWFADLRAKGVPQKDLVILLRAMTRVDTFEAALREQGFEVFVASGGTFFDAPEIEEMTALLRVVANTRDDEAFARVLTGRMANLSDDALFLIRRAASMSGPADQRRSLWEAALSDDRSALSPPDEERLGCVLDAIEAIRREQGRITLYDLIHSACEQVGYDLTLFAGGQRRAWANVLKFARLADEFERLAPGDPGAFLQYLGERQTHQRYEQQAATAAEDVDAVRIMSVHSAKGLEFPVVALAELGNRGYSGGRPSFDCGSPDATLTLGLRLPNTEPFCDRRDTAGSDAVRAWRAERDLDEAKRVLYVAATRATEALGMFAVVDSKRRLPEDVPVGWVMHALGLVSEEATAEEPSPAAGDVSVGARDARPALRPTAGALPRGTRQRSPDACHASAARTPHRFGRRADVQRTHAAGASRPGLVLTTPALSRVPVSLLRYLRRQARCAVRGAESRGPARRWLRRPPGAPPRRPRGRSARGHSALDSRHEWAGR